ncbi:LysM peptidoglycan-binding domain-containing protein [Streptomyces mirabilis]|uniref:LysM peptidoglycan-binding domain-containing protein n=1 Tax=Streptomyces mirabilis TaxID=68239 RepID=UPI0036BEA4A2
MPHSPEPARRFGLRALARGLSALSALALLLVAAPALLSTVGTLPAHIPSLDEARDALMTPDDGTVLMTTLTAAAWIAWLWLTLPVLIEIGAVLARRTTPRIPGMATGQRLAGFLLGSVLLASPAAAASAATPPTMTSTAAPHHTVSTGAAADPGQVAAVQRSSGGAAGGTTVSATGPVAQYTVSGDGTTWWELAEQLLGDGARYEQLRRLNPELPATTTELPAGTSLRVPATAVPGTPPAATATVSHAAAETPADDGSSEVRLQLAASTPAQAMQPTGQESRNERYTVRPGDSLSQIAEDKLGNANRWPAVYAESKGKAQPDGLPAIEDPDLIYPGQEVQLPVPASSSAQPPGQATDHDPGQRDNKPSARPSQPSTPGPGTSDPSKPTPGPSVTQHSTPSPSDRTGSPSTPHPSADETPPPAAAGSRSGELRMVLGAFALLAAAITGALTGRRVLQRRRRKPGETISIGAEPSPAAAQMAQLAEPGRAEDLDLALRTLAHRAQQEGRPLPVLRAARLTSHGLAVLPDDANAAPVAPFAAADGGWWAPAADQDLLTTDEAREVPAPYPALVTIGAGQDASALFLLNLATTRVLLLDGTPDDIRRVCTALALELGMSPWAQRMEIVTVGFGEELPGLLPTCRIAHKRQPAHAVHDLADWLLSAYQLPDEADQPYLLLCAATLDADTAWQLAEIIDKAHTLPAMVIAPAEHTSRHFADAEVLDASDTAPQEIDALGTSVVLQRLDDAAYQQIATELRISGQPPHPAEGAWRNVPAEPSTSQANTSQTPAGPRTASGTGTSSASAGSTGGMEVFPALLSAATDPAGVNLLASASPAPASTTEPASAAHSPAAEPPLQAEPAAPKDMEEEASQQAVKGLHSPELRVLGPVQVTGVSGTGHGPRQAQLAALLHFKPGRSADTLCTDMDPLTPWTKNTLNTRMSDLRRSLGDDPQGHPYVPRRASPGDPYAISPQVRCDWDQFTELSKGALDRGQGAVTELEAALALVRGKPFGGHPPPWAQPHAQEMATRIVDVAHTVTVWRAQPGPRHDLTAARQAVAVGLEVDDSAEVLYRAWLRIEHAAGNRSGLHAAITRLQQVNRSLDASLETETEQLVSELLSASPATVRL